MVSLSLNSVELIFAFMKIITFSIADHNITLRNRNLLKDKIFEMCTLNKIDLKSLTYVFCSDEYLLNINRQFLQHDDYTDVITFNLSESKNATEGEVYVSVQRVKENALNNNVSFKQELHRVIFHGALHLCGFNDKKECDKIAMRNAEDFWLQNYLGSV